MRIDVAEEWTLLVARVDGRRVNINVPACRFYARLGCVLGAIRPHAYAALPDEVQLIWQKQLTPG